VSIQLTICHTKITVVTDKKKLLHVEAHYAQSNPHIFH
jgi:hypothetical protein